MNVKSLVVGIIVIFIIVFIALFVFTDLKKTANTKKTGTVSENQTPLQNKVSINNSSFNPIKIKVKKGTMVTWTNNDNVKHTVTFDQVDTLAKSQLFGKGGQYNFTFDTAGIYTYHCEAHKNMKGTVEVTE